MGSGTKVGNNCSEDYSEHAQNLAQQHIQNNINCCFANHYPNGVRNQVCSQQEHPIGFDANKRVAQAGGSVAGNARKDLEQRLRRPIITSQKAAQLNHVVTQMIEASVAAADESTTTGDSDDSGKNTEE